MRILSECQNLDEAAVLISKAVGDLETECQAAETIFLMRRNTTPIEDFYAKLLEKDRKALLGTSVVIKKFILELPDGVKRAAQKHYKKVRERNPGLMTKEEADSIYLVTRTSYQEMFGTKKESLKSEEPQMSFPVEAEPAEKEEEDTDQALSRMLDEKVDAYFANRGRGQSAASSSKMGKEEIKGTQLDVISARSWVISKRTA